ncbi:MAG: dockerin type I repeat-containing protein [Clostridia bacterium]|nr:dockerin type I repeat-containing protein [Clostridia bacterium]MBR5428119.1 dockerin type I repeat-containing protein [Clostridia bacterium]
MKKALFFTIFALILAFVLFSSSVAASALPTADAEEGMDQSNNYLGDVDGNGKVTATDARMILRHAAKLEEIEPLYYFFGDVNCDSWIRSNDARLALRMAARLERLYTWSEGYHEHQFTEEVVKAPTCTEKGKKTQTCTVCGYQTTADIPTVPHDFAPATMTEPATCRVCGLTEGKPLIEQIKLIPDTTEVFLKKGGTALIRVTVDCPEEAYNYNLTATVMENSDDTVSYWMTYLEDESQTTDYIRIHALEETQSAVVTVCLKDYQEVNTNIRVTVGPSGADNYGGKGPFASVPDYGSLFGAGSYTVEYTYDEETGEEGFCFEYIYSDLQSAGFSDEKLVNDFTAKIEAAGFEYQGTLDGGGLVYRKDDVTVAFVCYVQNDLIVITVFK